MHRRGALAIAIVLVCLAAVAAAAGPARGDPAASRRAGPEVGLSQAGGYRLAGRFVPADDTDRAAALTGGPLSLAWSQVALASPGRVKGNTLYYGRSRPSPTLLGQTVPRSRSISPAGFIRDLTAPELTMTSDIGLRWQANTSEEAGFYMARPADWDGQSPVTVKITFALGGSTAGATNWRLKLNTYSPGSGEWLTNPATRNADAVLIFPAGPSWYRIYSQTFTLDAPAFHNEPLWSFFFLRGNAGNAETFTGDLYVLGAEVEYQAEATVRHGYLPIILR